MIFDNYDITMRDFLLEEIVTIINYYIYILSSNVSPT